MIWNHEPTHTHTCSTSSKIRKLKVVWQALTAFLLLSHHFYFHLPPPNCIFNSHFMLKGKTMKQNTGSIKPNLYSTWCTIHIRWPKFIYSEENFLFSTMWFSFPLCWVRRAFEIMWWEEVYHCTSVCKSGRFCCQNTANSPLHQTQKCRSSLVIYETVKWCIFHVERCCITYWVMCLGLSLQSVPELLFVCYIVTYSFTPHIWLDSEKSEQSHHTGLEGSCR